jgi:hypothetical protein
MIAFRGRSNHKVKLKNKPIDEGYKVWMVAQKGYTIIWLWHSKQDGPEGISKKGVSIPVFFLPPETVHLSPTFAVVLTLARVLRDNWEHQRFHFFLDNLFLNVPVARVLLFLDILCTGTTRKNALGIPSKLVYLKERNRALIWNSINAEIVDGVLCFLWQDNNAVLGIITGFNLFQKVHKLRKRPAQTSTNARIVRPIFGDEVRKRLYIPKVIDEYNYYINGVDVANQLRANYTIIRTLEHRV